MMHYETSSEETSNWGLVNRSLVSLQFKQNSFKLAVDFSKRKSWPVWTVTDNGAQSYFNFHVGFLPRPSQRLFSSADKMIVFAPRWWFCLFLLHLCGQQRVNPGVAAGGKVSEWVGDTSNVTEHGGGLDSQSSRQVCVPPLPNMCYLLH